MIKRQKVRKSVVNMKCINMGNICKPDLERESILNSIALPNFIWESEITEKDLITVLKNIPNGKYPRHDGLTKEFY